MNVFRGEQNGKKKQNLKIGILIGVTLGGALILYFFQWKFELPFHPTNDEASLSVGKVRTLLNGELIKNFNYPHLPYYYSYLLYKAVRIFIHINDLTLFVRIVECGFALLSNLCIYFSVKKLTGSRKWGYTGLLLALFSLYQIEYLYYAGPDTMLYGFSNIIILLGITIYLEKDKEKVIHKWYPLMAFFIGLATASKYHGILFGLYWLLIHILKKYYKTLKYNIVFCMDCLLIVITFVICNFPIFIYFNNFMEGFIFNLKHYSGGHIGIEHNFPLLAYTGIFALYGFGVTGTVLLLLGIISLIRNTYYRNLAITMLSMILVVIVVLSRYKIMLGRNIGLIVPFAPLFMTLGLYALEQNEKIRWKYKKICISLLAFIMVCVNIVAVIISESYHSSYQYAEQWIKDNIPKGSTIYVDNAYYMPRIASKDYNIISDGTYPDKLQDNEYFVTVGYASDRKIQEKDYLFFKGEYLYPELAEQYFDEIKKYSKIISFEGITYDVGLRYRIGYLDWLKYDKNQYYKGSTINIYSK